MLRLSKILEKHYPEIISNISDDKFYTFIVQGTDFKKIERKSSPVFLALNSLTAATLKHSMSSPPDVHPAWEGHYAYKGVFKNIIDKNVPCVLMHKVKNEWAPEVDTVVCFMTGECNDVFLVHPKDLMEWDPNEDIR